jgi:ATP-dependent Lon protease
MRDFRDTKAMAQTLREALTAKAVSISHSESLELVSRMLGVSDWNTLSALLQAEQRKPPIPATKHPVETVSYPAFPIRDFVPFPTTTFPLFVGRDKTQRALERAFERQREVVLVVQKNPAIEDPSSGDVYEIGVLGGLLDVERLPNGTMMGDRQVPDGTMKIVIQAYRRVLIRRFVCEEGAFLAEIADLIEGPIPDSQELIKRAVQGFGRYATIREISMPQTSPAFAKIRDPGRVADLISVCMDLPIGDKQGLLAILDPVARLESISALLAESGN